MADRRPAMLRGYHLLTASAVPVADAILKYRLKRGKEHAERMPERRGLSKIARPDGPLVWLHGASVGELIAILPLVERIRVRGIGVLVTTGTVTSAGLAEQRLPPGVIHQFAPVDMPQFVARFLEHWRPDLALFAESELWPNLIMGCAERSIPLILVNGRMSDRSYRQWRLTPRTIGALLQHFELCLAQSAEDAARYESLGALRCVTIGNLKLDAPVLPADAEKLAALKAAIGARPVLVGASTHAGEETVLIEVHRKLRQTFPDLLTVLVPRHPERGPDIAEIAKTNAVSFALRSCGELPEASTEIYVADTLGELGSIYRIAPVVFMGGSLIRHGGQNPIEAVRLGAAILHGPHIWNFSEIYSTLDTAGGAALVGDAVELADRVGAWLRDDEARKKAAENGLKAIEPLVGALDRTMAALDPYLSRFGLKRRRSIEGNA